MEDKIDTLSIAIESEGKDSGKKIDEFISKLKELDSTVQASNFSHLVGNIQSATVEINRLTNAITKLNNTDVSKITNKLANIKTPKIGSSDNGGTSGTPSKSSETEDIGGEIGNAESNVESFGSKLSNFLSTIKTNSLEALGGSISFVSSKLSGLASGGLKLASSGTQKLSSTTLSLGKHLLNMGTNAAKTGVKMANAFSKDLSSKIKQVGLSLLGTRTAFTAVRKAVSEYMNYDTQLSKTIQNDWAVLGSLLAPILEKVISLFSKAVAYINAFVEALTGINLVAKANSKALNSETAAAKKTLGALASFDDLHTVDFSESSGSSSSTTPLTTESVDTSAIDELIAKLEGGDWYNIGLEVGQKLTDGLASIDFTPILNKATEFGTKLSDLFDGLVNGIDWQGLGSAIGNGLEVAINFVYSFFTNTDWSTLGVNLGQGILSAIEQIDFEKVGTILISKVTTTFSVLAGVVTTPGLWDEIGTSISDMFNGAWESIKWGDIAVTIGEGLKGAFSSITTFLQQVDWQQIGQDIANFLASIDWNGILQSFFTTLGTLSASIAEFITGLLGDAWTSVIDYFGYWIESAEEQGGDVIQGLLLGIGNAIMNVGQWIWDNIFTPFINGFCDAFGIHSPSTVMAEMGGYIIDGLKNGLSNIWEKIKEIFENLKTSISNKFTEIHDKIKEIIENVKNTVANIFNAIKEKILSIVDTIKTKVTDRFNTLKTAVTTVFTKLKDSMKTIWDGIWSTIKGVINKIIEGVEKLCNTVIGGLNKIIQPLTEVGNTILEAIGIDNFHFNIIGDVSLPRLATGTNRIPKEGPYYLHKNEAVVPEKYNPAVNNQSYNEASKDTIDALYSLIDVVKNMETSTVVNVGNKKLYEGTISYIKRRNTINGTNTIDI